MALEPILIVPDFHIPYHSRVGKDLLLQVGHDLKPKHLVAIGDLMDCYSISDHDKDPTRANRMAWEFEEVNAVLDELDALGATDKLYIEGNHEDRLRRAVQKHPWLTDMLSLEEKLGLKRRKWQYVRYKDHAKRGAAHFTHDVGSAGRNAIYSALAIYQKTIVTGHTHRCQYVVEGSVTGEPTLAASFGWLGDVEQIDYMNKAKARKEWALSFGAGYLDTASGIVYLTPIPVVRKTVCFNGKVYRSRLTDAAPKRRAA